MNNKKFGNYLEKNSTLIIVHIWIADYSRIDGSWFKL